MRTTRAQRWRRSVALAFCGLALLGGATLPEASAQQRQKPPKGKPRADVVAFRVRVEAALSEVGVDKGYWAVLVADAVTGGVLFELNPAKYFTPASNVKLMTTALALATLGPDYRVRTTIETRGTIDRHGRLRGDLVLVGRGDPSISNRRYPFSKETEREGPPEKILDELVGQVVARGVKQIEGDIIADDSYFAYDRFPSGWSIDDMVAGYGAPVSALAVNDNVVFVEFRPGEREGDPAWFSVEPWADYYEITNEVRTGAPNSERKIELLREPGSRRVVLRGNFPVGAESHSVALAVEEPAEHAAHLLKRLLESRGVRVYGQPRAQHQPELVPVGATLLAERLSVPLVELVRVVNKVSQNLHAELLLRIAARERAGATSTDGALKFARDFLRLVGIEEGDLVLHDGSGLSRRNLVTPRALVKLLQYVVRQSWGEAFRSTLPVAGEDGTLADRMKDTRTAGRIQAKTGSLDHVNALAGFATTMNGNPLIFSIFGNHHALRGKAATQVVDAVCAAMVEEIGAPPKKRRRR